MSRPKACGSGSFSRSHTAVKPFTAGVPEKQSVMMRDVEVCHVGLWPLDVFENHACGNDQRKTTRTHIIQFFFDSKITKNHIIQMSSASTDLHEEGPGLSQLL